MGESIKTLAAIFAIAGGVCLGVGGVSQLRSGDTHNGAGNEAAAVLAIASGIVAWKLRRN